MSKLAQYENTNLVSRRRLDFMRDHIFVMPADGKWRTGLKLSRADLLDAQVLDPARTARRLAAVCGAYGIDTCSRLYDVGFGGLAKCEGVGESLLWMAAYVVQKAGYEILDWIKREGAISKVGAIRTAARRAKGRKDPRPGRILEYNRTRQRSVRHRG